MNRRLDEPRRGDTVAAPIRAFHWRFTSEAPAGVVAQKHFTQPRAAAVVAEPLALESLDEGGLPASDAVVVIVVPEGHPPEVVARLRRVLSETTPELCVKHGLETVEYWPGRALVSGSADGGENVVAGLLDFAFYDGELRALSRIVADGERCAAADLQAAQRLAAQDRERWPHFMASMQRYGAARLAFARLEPELNANLSSLPAASRRWLERLYEAAAMEDRAEALGDRLEAVEDFYEGATQRIADYRWYHEERAIELGIVVLLVLECLLMAADVVMHAAR